MIGRLAIEKNKKNIAIKILIQYIPYSWDESLISKLIELDAPKYNIAFKHIVKWYKVDKTNISIIIALADIYVGVGMLSNATKYYNIAANMTTQTSHLIKIANFFCSQNNLARATDIINKSYIIL